VKGVAAFASQVFPPTGIFGNTLNEDGHMYPNSTLMENDYFYWKQLGGSAAISNWVQCDAQTCVIGLPAAGFSINCTESTDRVDWGASAQQALISNQVTGYQDLLIASTD
jgi:hypothetical protein